MPHVPLPDNEGMAKRLEDGRLAWYGATADDAFWLDHWRIRLESGHLDEAARADPAHDELGRLILGHLPAGGRILEAGCGVGWWVAVLGGLGWDVQGIERAEALVDLVQRAAPSLPVAVGDALAIDAPDGSFDGYLSIGVVEHRREGVGPYLREAHRVLRQGGRAVVAVPALGPTRRLKGRLGRYRDPVDDRPFFQYGFAPDDLAAEVEQAGLAVRATGYYGAHRMLREEVPGYRWLTLHRGGRHVKAAAGRLVDGRDGHMVAVVAEKRR